MAFMASSNRLDSVNVEPTCCLLKFRQRPAALSSEVFGASGGSRAHRRGVIVLSYI